MPGLISPLDGTEKVSADGTFVLPNITLFIDRHLVLFVSHFKQFFKKTKQTFHRHLWFSSPANHMFQYFITIVPTKLNTYKVSAETHQYSVTEQVRLNFACMFVLSALCQYGEYVCIPLAVLQDRVINHAAGSHGVSGIFMKYDISSLMVKVTEQHMPLWQFLVRLCGIIGGIFTTTGR